MRIYLHTIVQYLANVWVPYRNYTTKRILFKKKYELAVITNDLKFRCEGNNINGRDVQRKNVVNNVDKSGLWAP